MSSSKEEELDFRPLTFGKYRGKTPEQVAEIDPSYVCWMYKEVKPTPCSLALQVVCENEVRESKAEWGSQDDVMDTYDKFSDRS
jgi:hypothetical protein